MGFLSTPSAPRKTRSSLAPKLAKLACQPARQPGSPRYTYGETSWNIPRQYIEKRERLRAVAVQFGADLRTAALQFSAAPDVAVALIVGAHTEAQVLANVSSMQSTIPPEFWAELKRQNLIEQNAPTPRAT